MKNAKSFRQLSSSPIARDRQLATFVVKAYETMTLKEVRQACIEQFGEEKAPSTSSISRFLLRTSKRD